MSKMLDWLSAVIAGLTCAAPQQDVLDHRDRPSMIAWTDPASHYRRARADRDTGFCQEHNGRDARW